MTYTYTDYALDTANDIRDLAHDMKANGFDETSYDLIRANVVIRRLLGRIAAQERTIESLKNEEAKNVALTN